MAFYNEFAGRVSALRHSLSALLLSEKAKGNRIACYGAAAKSATLVNYLDLGEGFFEFLVTLQGKYTLGQRIPIDIRIGWRRTNRTVSVWNFAGEVMRQQTTYRQRGRQFHDPGPEPYISNMKRTLKKHNAAFKATMVLAARHGDRRRVGRGVRGHSNQV